MRYSNDVSSRFVTLRVATRSHWVSKEIRCYEIWNEQWVLQLKNQLKWERNKRKISIPGLQSLIRVSKRQSIVRYVEKKKEILVHRYIDTVNFSIQSCVGVGPHLCKNIMSAFFLISVRRSYL